MPQFTPLPRCTPEAVGIPSSAVHRLLDALEYGGFTQMHGLMILRRGQVCAEGWWAPYAPGQVHSDHSLSKTYTATAVGLAEREGLLSLSDQVCGLLPEWMPCPLPPRLAALTVRDLLVMGSGSETEADGYPADWLRDFFARPQEHEPGAFWRYNSHGTSVLSAIVEKLSGQRMIDYLTPRLFDKIGIDAARVLCRRAQDGTCIGGSGMFTTTEDNLRLMMLYLQGGVWQGERLLGERFVRDAVSPLMDTAPAHAHTPWIDDNLVGYGYQIWRCRYPGAYRADGAYGQFAVVIPSLDMVVSINECGYLGEHMTHNELEMLRGKPGEDAPVHGPQATLNALFDILIPAVRSEPLPPDRASDTLRQRMARLALPRPAAEEFRPERQMDVLLHPAEGKISFGILYGMKKHAVAYAGADEIHLEARDGLLRVSFTENGCRRTFDADLRGGRQSGRLSCTDHLEVVSRICAAAWWAGETLQLSLLWVETECENRFSFAFSGDRVTVRKWIAAGVFGAQAQEEAVYTMERSL